MDKKVVTYHLTSLNLCDKLINELKNNKEDADSFFGGEVHKAYIKATDMALDKAKNIRAKLRRL